MRKDVKELEFKINIEECSKEYVDGLILGLVHAGYNAYFSFKNQEVCFTGWSDEIITQKVEIVDNE